MKVSERNGTSNLIIKPATNFLAKIIMCMISNCLSQIRASLHCTYGADKECTKHSEQSRRGVKHPPPI